MERVGLNRTTADTESILREKRAKEFAWHLCHSRVEHGRSLNKVMERGMEMGKSEDSEVKKPNQAVLDKADESWELTINLLIDRDFTFQTQSCLESW